MSDDPYEASRLEGIQTQIQMGQVPPCVSTGDLAKIYKNNPHLMQGTEAHKAAQVGDYRYLDSASSQSNSSGTSGGSSGGKTGLVLSFLMLFAIPFGLYLRAHELQPREFLYDVRRFLTRLNDLKPPIAVQPSSDNHEYVSDDITDKTVLARLRCGVEGVWFYTKNGKRIPGAFQLPKKQTLTVLERLDKRKIRVSVLDNDKIDPSWTAVIYEAMCEVFPEQDITKLGDARGILIIPDVVAPTTKRNDAYIVSPSREVNRISHQEALKHKEAVSKGSVSSLMRQNAALVVEANPYAGTPERSYTFDNKGKISKIPDEVAPKTPEQDRRVRGLAQRYPTIVLR